MQIIDIGICIDNTDPKGLGRIRYRPYSLYESEIKLAFNYSEWDENDPFIAIPFLPLHINIIPQEKQSVKLLRYDTEKPAQNVEYVSGPFSSPHNLDGQTFTAQHKDTTYGGEIVKSTKDIRDVDGKFNSPASPGAVIKDSDTGFRGKYGSDIIFTENGLQLRGGMLKVKEGRNKQSILDFPQLGKKMGRLSLKKFSKTLQSVEEVTTTTEVDSARLKFIVEYELDDLTNPTELKLFVYKVLPNSGEQFMSDVFSYDSPFNTGDENLVKLINTGNTTTDATYTVALDGTIRSGYIELREALYLIDTEGLTSLYYTYSNETIHPFYYRPTSSLKLDDSNNTNKTIFLNGVQVRSQQSPGGLVFSRQSAAPPIVEKEKIQTVAREVKNGGEQALSNYSADRIYITSTSPNTGTNVKKIDFDALDQYELTQDDYINKIEPNTYGMVRGENLYNLLVSMKNLFDSHIHNINEPLVKTDPNWVKLNELIETMRNDLLNDSLRIN